MRQIAHTNTSTLTDVKSFLATLACCYVLVLALGLIVSIGSLRLQLILALASVVECKSISGPTKMGV